MKNVSAFFAAFIFAAAFGFAMQPTPAHADDSAMENAGDAASSGSDAVMAPSNEQAHGDASQVFDTPAAPYVDTRTPSEGDSGLSNAPTYNENTGSGLSNAPTP